MKEEYSFALKEEMYLYTLKAIMEGRAEPLRCSDEFAPYVESLRESLWNFSTKLTEINLWVQYWNRLHPTESRKTFENAAFKRGGGNEIEFYRLAYDNKLRETFENMSCEELIKYL